MIENHIEMSKGISTKKNPLFILVLGSIFNICITLLGLMSVTQSKIKWKSYFHDAASFYKENITDPIRSKTQEIIELIDNKFELNFDWILLWLPDYIPIASAFFVGFTVSYCYLKQTNPVMIVYDYIFKEFIPDLLKKEEGTIFSFIFTIFYLLIVFLTSPILYISIPVLFIGLLIGSITIASIVLYYMARFLLIVFLSVFSIVCIIWYLINKESFKLFIYKMSKKIRKFCINKYHFLLNKYHYIVKEFPNLKSKFINFLNESKPEVKAELSYFFQLFYFQYIIVIIIGGLFLIAFAMNSSFLAE